MEPTLFRHTLSEEEIASGTLKWTPADDETLHRLLPGALMFDIEMEGVRLANLAPEWDRRELCLGEVLKKARPGLELVMQTGTGELQGVLVATLAAPNDGLTVRKKLSLNELRHRRLRWYARDELTYRQLFPEKGSLTVQIGDEALPNRVPDFERRFLFVGEPLCQFSPGDILVLTRRDTMEGTIVAITRENRAQQLQDAGTALRSLVARLLSRPLKDFNEGEVRALIVLLDENKTLWERIVRLQDENERLKEQVATLEDVFSQFAANSFFGYRREFETWVVDHLGRIERGLRLLAADVPVTWEDGKERRIDLVCQDRKGGLVVVEILFNPSAEDVPQMFRMMAGLKRNLSVVAEHVRDQLPVPPTSVRGIVVTNKEPPQLVELCLVNNVKLCLINSGYVVDIIE